MFLCDDHLSRRCRVTILISPCCRSTHQHRLNRCMFLIRECGTFLPLAVVISVTKEGVKFSTGGDIGSANIICRQNTSVDKVSGPWWM